MNVLAVDQGTSATKALVIGDDGRVLGAAECPVHPSAPGDGAVEQDPGELLASVVAAGRAGARPGGGGGPRRRPRQPGGDGPRLGPRDRGAADHRVVLAGPAGDLGDRRARRGPPPPGRHQRPAARPVLLGAEDGLAAAEPHRGRGGHDDGHLAAARAHRTVRHRRHHGIALDGARPRPTGLVRRGRRRSSGSTSTGFPRWSGARGPSGRRRPSARPCR